MIAQLLARTQYLKNFGAVQASRKGEERFLFFAGERFFDAWYDVERGALGELHWWSPDEFRVVLQQMFGDVVGPSFLGSYAEIPPVVLAEAPRRADQAERLLALLANESVWLDLRRSWRKDFVNYLRHDGPLGWHALYLDEKGRFTGVSRWSAARARDAVEETLRHWAEAEPATADAAIIARAAGVRAQAAATVDRMKGGEALQLAPPPLEQLVLHVGAAFVWARVSVDDLVTDVSGREESRIFDDLLGTFSRGGTPTLVTPTQPRRDEVAIKADPGRYLELLRRGELHVGGGTTTDMQWSLSCRDGCFLRSASDGYEVREEPVEESHVLDVLANRRYGWIRFPP